MGESATSRIARVFVEGSWFDAAGHRFARAIEDELPHVAALIDDGIKAWFLAEVNEAAPEATDEEFGLALYTGLEVMAAERAEWAEEDAWATLLKELSQAPRESAWASLARRCVELLPFRAIVSSAVRRASC